MDRHVLLRLRLLLSIVLLLSFASCTHPARGLQWKSTLSPYDCIPIGKPSRSSHATLSLYNIIPSGQPHSHSPSPSASSSASQIIHIEFGQPVSSSFSPSSSSSSSISQTTIVTYVTTPLTAPFSLPLSPPNFGYVTAPITPLSSPIRYVTAPFSPPSSAPTPNVTYETSPITAVSSAPPPNVTYETAPTPVVFCEPQFQSDFYPPTRTDPSGKIIPIAVIVLALIFSICVYLGFKNASRNKNDNDSGVGTMAQLANPGGNSLEVGSTDIRTHIVEEPDSLKVSVINSRTHIVEEPDDLRAGIDIHTYTREELANATENFTTKIGQGVSGFVYRANLPGNKIGAVKRATDLDPELFRQELSVLLRLPHHPHLVALIGLCLQPGAGDAGERILVFEFISNGNLYDRLHKNKDKGLSTLLSWAARMDIAYQVAVALQYLHEEPKPPILHRDVKSANVLLVDDNYAKLADFGLSKLGPKNNQFTVTAVRGSYGYMDPQYVKTLRYSVKSDVYSFGVTSAGAYYWFEITT